MHAITPNELVDLFRKAPKHIRRDVVRLLRSEELRIPRDEIIRVWNDTVAGTPVPALRSITGGRATKLRSRWAEWSREGDPMAVFRSLIAAMLASPWHMGDNDRGWVTSIDYLIQNETKWVQLLERASAKPRRGHDEEWE